MAAELLLKSFHSALLNLRGSRSIPFVPPWRALSRARAHWAQDPPPHPPIWKHEPKIEKPLETIPTTSIEEIALPIELTPNNWYDLVIEKDEMTVKDKGWFINFST